MTSEQTKWLRWLLARLRERSTWNGLIGLFTGVTGVVVGLDTAEIAGGVGGALAILNVFWPDAPDPGEVVDDPWAEAQESAASQA